MGSVCCFTKAATFARNEILVDVFFLGWVYLLHIPLYIRRDADLKDYQYCLFLSVIIKPYVVCLIISAILY